jgi:hypothetical protein
LTTGVEAETPIGSRASEGTVDEIAPLSGAPGDAGTFFCNTVEDFLLPRIKRLDSSMAEGQQ